MKGFVSERVPRGLRLGSSSEATAGAPVFAGAVIRGGAACEDAVTSRGGELRNRSSAMGRSRHGSQGKASHTYVSSCVIRRSVPSTSAAREAVSSSIITGGRFRAGPLDVIGSNQPR